MLLARLPQEAQEGKISEMCVVLLKLKLCLVSFISAVGDATQSRNAPCGAEGFRARDPAFIKAH